jgi:BASS family bile acid:Na+ symporter
VPVVFPFQPELLIRALTVLSLGGLLFAIGLRLELRSVALALQGCRLALILPLNFVIVPLATYGFARGFGVPAEYAAGMLLLAAAPFAPVVPVFVKMAHGDLALAAGLTAVFPLFSTVFTPPVAEAGLAGLGLSASRKFRFLGMLAVLFSTVAAPLLFGLAVRRWLPGLARRLLRPLEVLAEATGAVSLAFIAWIASGTLLATGWRTLLAMALASELCFFLGYRLGGPGRAGRRVIAFGTANRNIALAILVAVETFAGTQVVVAVVANGLLLIFLGLLHVAWYRFVAPEIVPMPTALDRRRPE